MNKKELKKNLFSQYDLLLEKTGDVLFFTTDKGYIMEANKSAVQVYGYDNQEFLSMRIQDLQNKKEVERFENCQTGKIRVEHLTKDGHLIPVEIFTIKLNQSNNIYLHLVSDLSEVKLLKEQVNYLKNYDPLTNIPNASYFERTIKKLINEAKDEENIGSLIFFSIDNFKIVNSNFGYNYGDQLLKNLIAIVQSKIKKGDFLARLYGDEFAILLKCKDVKEAWDFAEELRYEIEQNQICSITEKELCVNLTVSIGISILNSLVNYEEVFLRTYNALNRAQEEGKNRVVALEMANTRTIYSENKLLINEIKKNITNNRFVLNFQPIINLATKEILHYEVLLRMLNENNELIPPSKFIPIAESFGLMSQIDNLVIEKSFEFLNQTKNINLFINLSGMNLNNESILNKIKMELKKYNINPQRIGFEITETSAIKNLEKASFWIEELKKQGCKFALDDFGVGFSSFSHLKRLPVDYLKIDGSFIKEIDTNQTNQSLVKAIVDAAHSINLETIAEFVENENVVRKLQELNVDFAQGYYFGKPTPWYK